MIAPQEVRAPPLCRAVVLIAFSAVAVMLVAFPIPPAQGAATFPGVLGGDDEAGWPASRLRRFVTLAAALLASVALPLCAVAWPAGRAARWLGHEAAWRVGALVRSLQGLGACSCAALGVSANLASVVQLLHARRGPASLIVDGVFGVVQHPITTGNVMLLAGLVLCAAPRSAVCWTSVGLIAQHLESAACQEEAHLSRAFGARHTVYAASTPRFVPFS